MNIKHPLQYKGNLIQNEWSIPNDPQSKWTLYSPADKKDKICDLYSSYQNIEEAIDSSKSAQKLWKKLKPEQRFEYLKKLQSEMKLREEAFIEIISREVGKPEWESKTEFTAAVNKIDITLNESMSLVKDSHQINILPDSDGITQYRPHGIMVVVGPFNFPLHLANGHIIPALATGNSVILKPSEKTPMTAQLYAECFIAAGFPKGIFNLIQGDKEVSRRLCLHEEVKGILFTGSYEVGLRIKQDTLNQHWKILALEMGGKNPSIVWKDCKLDHAVYETLVSAFITTGQRCSATSRVLLHESIADEFISKLHQYSKNFIIDHPKNNPFMGPLIDNTSVDRYLKFQPIAGREGYETIMRGKQLDGMLSENYVTPTLLVQKNADLKSTLRSTIAQTELFSPMLAIQIVNDEALTLDLANASQYGLVASVFTQSRETFEYFSQDLEYGLINWNRGTVGASSRLPFGGLKKSGNHMPTALTSTLYCSSPIASLENKKLELPKTLLTGIVDNPGQLV